MRNGNKNSGGGLEYPVRLVKFLSACGVASRRKCEEIVRDGEVTVNGRKELEPGSFVKDGDMVCRNGIQVLPSARLYYIMLNKPRGYVCSSSDRHADKLAVDLIGIKDARLFSAGRLDKDSEGLIIFTNDGGYAQRLVHPRHEVRKIYRVELERRLSRTEEKGVLRGIVDGGEVLKALKVERSDENCYLLTLNEGKKREIRRLISHFGIKINRLMRVSIGGLNLGGLAPGRWRHLSGEEIAASLEPGGA